MHNLLNTLLLSALTLSSTIVNASENPSLETMIASADLNTAKNIVATCSACHSFEKGGPAKIGPALWGIINRPIASVEGFKYSAALSSKKGTWDHATLDAFLTSPGAFAPGTTMAIPGFDDQNTRAHIIRFLHSLNDEPATFEQKASSKKIALKDSFGSAWPQGKGRDITGHTCNACHSLAIVKQQGLTAEGWSELIDWMVEEQGMSEPTAADRSVMVDYLGKHFSIKKDR